MISCYPRKGTTIWFGMLILLYLLFVTIFLSSTGLSGFWVVNWSICQKVALFAVPLYILILWHRREDLVRIDYHAVYLPVVVWFLVSIWRPKSLMNLVIVEPAMVVLLMGIYLGRFLVMDRFSSLDPKKTAAVFLVVVLALAIGVGLFVPFIGE